MNIDKLLSEGKITAEQAEELKALEPKIYGPAPSSLGEPMDKPDPE